MNVSDLIGIGRLGGPDSEGFFQVLIKPSFRSALAETDEVYLIFNSDRVFFVTISERDISDRKIRIKFAEEGIAEERKLHKEVIVAIPPEPAAEETPESLMGFAAVFQKQEIGKVNDYFHNNAQFVLVVQTPAGKEILVPMVEYYVAEVVADSAIVVLTNMESLLSEDPGQ